MIARMWHGTVPVSKSDVYLYLLRNIALVDYKSVAGNLGAFAFHRVSCEVAHFVTLTFWESEDSIKRFAGENIEMAKYYDFDRYFLCELEPHVTHYKVFDSPED